LTEAISRNISVLRTKINSFCIKEMPQVKNAWSYTSISPYVSVVGCLVKYHGQLCLYGLFALFETPPYRIPLSEHDEPSTKNGPLLRFHSYYPPPPPPFSYIC
jgi:hypothetical protein